VPRNEFEIVSKTEWSKYSMSVFETRIDVRFRDLDAMGHVNHAVFFTYFAEGRNRLFFDFFNISDPFNLPIIMAHVSCDYLKPIKLFTNIMVQMWVQKIGNKSFDLGYSVVDTSDKNIIYARGESVQVYYNYNENKPMKIPENLRQELQNYLRLERSLHSST
jgi:acyl-CoA thioester hydrolase